MYKDGKKTVKVGSFYNPIDAKSVDFKNKKSIKLNLTVLDKLKLSNIK